MTDQEPNGVELRTFAVPDEAAVVMNTIIINSYLREDGSAGYSVETRGEAPMTTYLGLLVVAQDDVLQWRRNDD